jgi:hypothetical protein
MRNHFCSFSIALLLSLSTAQAHAGEIYGNTEDPVVAEVLGTQIMTKNPEEMQYVINQILFQNYAQQNKIEAASEDIDLYIAAMDQFTRDDRKKSDARRADIRQQFKSGSLPAEETQRLQSELNTLETLHQYDLQEESENKQDPEAALKDKQTVAKAFIEQWMINKALYQQYGGRIIYQQGGPEPLDAMRDYLKEQQQKGAFKILEKSFEAPFWDYFVNDSKHDFFKPGSKEEKQAFGKAPWRQKQEN